MSTHQAIWPSSRRESTAPGAWLSARSSSRQAFQARKTGARSAGRELASAINTAITAPASITQLNSTLTSLTDLGCALTVLGFAQGQLPAPQGGTAGDYKSSTAEGGADRLFNVNSDSVDLENGTMQWKGTTMNLGNTRTVRARFER